MKRKYIHPFISMQRIDHEEMIAGSNPTPSINWDEQIDPGEAGVKEDFFKTSPFE